MYIDTNIHIHIDININKQMLFETELQQFFKTPLLFVSSLAHVCI